MTGLDNGLIITYFNNGMTGRDNGLIITYVNNGMTGHENGLTITYAVTTRPSYVKESPTYVIMELITYVE